MRRKRRSRKNKNILHVAVKQKQKSKKMQGRMTYIGIGFVVVCLALVALTFIGQQIVRVALYENDDFKIKTIEVEVRGDSISDSEIIRWAGIREGQNIWTVDLNEVEKRLRQMPSLAHPKVIRDLPSTIRLIGEERQPVARILPYLPGKAGQYAKQEYYIDAMGYIMKPKEGEKLKPLPIIVGISADLIREGYKTNRAEILSAINLLRIANFSRVRSELDRTIVKVQSKDYLVLRTRKRGHILFRVDHLSQQIQRLELLFDKIKQKWGRHRQIKYIDLTPEVNVPVAFVN